MFGNAFQEDENTFSFFSTWMWWGLLPKVTFPMHPAASWYTLSRHCEDHLWGLFRDSSPIPVRPGQGRAPHVGGSLKQLRAQGKLCCLLGHSISIRSKWGIWAQKIKWFSAWWNLPLLRLASEPWFPAKSMVGFPSLMWFCKENIHTWATTSRVVLLCQSTLSLLKAVLISPSRGENGYRLQSLNIYINLD